MSYWGVLSENKIKSWDLSAGLKLDIKWVQRQSDALRLGLSSWRQLINDDGDWGGKQGNGDRHPRTLPLGNCQRGNDACP